MHSFGGYLETALKDHCVFMGHKVAVGKAGRRMTVGRKVGAGERKVGCPECS